MTTENKKKKLDGKIIYDSHYNLKKMKQFLQFLHEVTVNGVVDDVGVEILDDIIIHMLPKYRQSLDEVLDEIENIFDLEGVLP